MTHLDRLFTEMRNEKTMNLDSLRPIEIVKLINEEDKKWLYLLRKSWEISPWP